MIHVCFGLHDADGKYAKFVGAAMVSIFEKMSAPVTIHILHDSTLTVDNRDKFFYLAGRYGRRVNFYNVWELFPKELASLNEKLSAVFSSRFSVGTFYRLLIKQVIGSGKVIYLDADIIVNLDLTELWRQDLQNFPLAAVPEVIGTSGFMVINRFLFRAEIVRKENYFNAGVILFNLNEVDEKFFYDAVNFLAENPACESPSQDALNAFFSANYLKLEQKFDAFVAVERRINLSVANKIYHYAGHCIELNTSDPYNRLFLENFTRTPWFNVDALDNLSETIQQSKDKYTFKFQRVLKACAEHRRALFVESHNVQVAALLLSLQNDEQIIEDNGENSLNELLMNMREQRGRTLFFICCKDYKTVRAQLLASGFAEFQDFMNGLEFMTRAQCGTSALLGYEFIRAL